ncbi:MAG: hypothetical protein CSA65_04040 [Proteobacteria bacterium]|nr:MAG: hypothetical protein CSA65_04040 [Pseudomonadota bacterium]
MRVLKVLLVLAVLGGGGYFLYIKVLRPPEKTVCVKLADLCGGEKATKAHVERCEQGIEKLKKVGGERAINKAATCINEVDTCPKAIGCIFGGSMSALGDVLKGMMKGMAK